ncbi:MAG: guanylate kinase, partial [Deltaproteobacteria bacterium]
MPDKIPKHKPEQIPKHKIDSIRQKPSNSSKNGSIFIISAPSGAGKTTLCNALLNKFPDLHYSISHTTRKPRTGESDGVDYFFITSHEFKQNIENGTWAEWAQVHDHFYGTSAQFIDHHLSEGKDILLDIDVNGASQIMNRYPDSITIFIMP